MNWRKFRAMVSLPLSKATDHARSSFSEAYDIAASRKHESIKAEHVFAGIVRLSGRSRRTILGRLGRSFDSGEVAELTGPSRPEGPLGRLDFDRSARNLLAEAIHQARASGHRHLGTEHLLVALLLGPHDSVRGFLHAQGLSPGSVRVILDRPSA